MPGFGEADLCDPDSLMRDSFCMSASRSVEALCSPPDKAQGSGGIDGKTEVCTSLSLRFSPGPVWTVDDKKPDKRQCHSSAFTAWWALLHKRVDTQGTIVSETCECVCVCVGTHRYHYSCNCLENVFKVRGRACVYAYSTLVLFIMCLL